jgi:hypothetical protein
MAIDDQEPVRRVARSAYCSMSRPRTQVPPIINAEKAVTPLDAAVIQSVVEDTTEG